MTRLSDGRTHGRSLFVDRLPPVIKEAITTLAADTNTTVKATTIDLLTTALAQRKRIHHDDHGNLQPGARPRIQPAATTPPAPRRRKATPRED